MKIGLPNGEVIELTSKQQADLLSSFAPAEASLPSLTARQLRLGLVTHGIDLSDVDAAIAGIDDPQDKAKAKIEWEYASIFERDHPLIAEVGAVLGLTEAQIDEMWQNASSL